MLRPRLPLRPARLFPARLLPTWRLKSFTIPWPRYNNTNAGGQNAPRDIDEAELAESDGAEDVIDTDDTQYSMRDQLDELWKQTSHLPAVDAERKIAATIVHGRSFFPPYHHKPTHHIPVASVQFRAYTPQILDFFVNFAAHAAAALAVPVSHPVHLPTQRRLWTVLKGPFAHKKNQENFDRRVHKRLLKAYDADAEVVERWMSYLIEHRMSEVGMRVTRWERVPIGVGQLMLDGARSRVRGGAVKELGDQIVRESLAASEMAANAENTVLTQKVVSPPSPELPLSGTPSQTEPTSVS